MTEVFAHPGSWGLRMRRATVCLALFLAVLAPAGLSRGQIISMTPAKDSAAMQQAKNIALMLTQYSLDNAGAYPTGKSSTEIFQKLIDGNYASDPSVFWLPMPGKTKPASNQLKPENVCFDVTTPMDADAPGDLPVVFLTGFKIAYASGGSATPLFQSTPGRLPGIAVCYKNSRAVFMRINAGPGGVVPNVIPSNFDPAAKKYQQLTPDGPLPDTTP